MVAIQSLTSSQKFALRVRHSLDHVFSVAGIKEKLTTFGVGNEFDKVCVAAHRKQKVKLVHPEHPTQIRKGNRSVVFEFESVGKLVGRRGRRTLLNDE